MDKIHVFEQAGLGKGPFVCLGIKELHYGNASAGQDFGGSCEYCGHYIRNAFMIQSSDGKIFMVGSDCVNKTGDKGLRNKVSEEIARMKREKQHQDWKWAQEVYPKYADRLEIMPHPYMSDKTMYDYIVYSLNHGHYTSTENRIISAVRKAERMTV